MALEAAERAMIIYTNFLLMGQGFKVYRGRAFLLGPGASPAAQQLVDSCGDHLVALVPAGGVAPRKRGRVPIEDGMKHIRIGIEGAQKVKKKKAAIIKRKGRSKWDHKGK